MIDNRNMILAVVLSIAILLGFEWYSAVTRPPPPVEQAETAVTDKPAEPVPGLPVAQTPPTTQEAQVPAVPGQPQIAGGETRAEILARNNRIRIDTPRLHGSISLTGGRIDDLTLADYREEIDPDSPEIVLLSPKGVDGAYYAQFGWVAGNGAAVPGADTVWTADRQTLTPEAPVTLSWDNGQGLAFTRTYAIDANYMFKITQRVENAGSAAASLHAYGLVSRRGTPETTGFYILHEGLLGVFEGTLSEIDYDDIQE